METDHSRVASRWCCAPSPPLFWCPGFVSKMQRCQHQRPLQRTGHSRSPASVRGRVRPSILPRRHLGLPARFDLAARRRCEVLRRSARICREPCFWITPLLLIRLSRQQQYLTKGWPWASIDFSWIMFSHLSMSSIFTSALCILLVFKQSMFYY